MGRGGETGAARKALTRTIDIGALTLRAFRRADDQPIRAAGVDRRQALAFGRLGLLAWRRQLAYADLLLAWILLRTAYLTTVETPEPRYVLECFPALFVLAGLGITALQERFHLRVPTQ